MTGPILGPRTLSGANLALLTVVGAGAALVSDPAADFRGRVLWLGAGILAQLPLALAYVLAERMGAGRSRAAVLITVIVGAAVRAVALVFIIAAAGIIDPLPTAQRITAATVTMTAWGLLLGALVQSWSDYRVSLRSLLQRVDKTVADANDLSTEWQSRLQQTTLTPAALAQTAAALHNDIERRLRPLSHRLWFGITDRDSRTHFIRAVFTESMPVAWISLTTYAFYLWTTAQHFGVVHSAIAGAVTVTAMALMLLGADRVSRRFPRHAVAIRVLAIALAALTPVPIDEITTGFRDLPGLAAAVLGILTIVLGVQALAVSLRLRRASLASLNAQVDTLDADRVQVASNLHSTLQSRWTAAAMGLAKAAESGDVTQAQQALAQARRVVQDSNPRGVVPADLQALAQGWEGIAAIDLRVSAEVPAQAPASLYGIVEEAISNAIRHGRARNIEVLVTASPNSIEIVVADDGSGIDPQASTGLGTRLLDSAATWDRRTDGSGTVLRASIPMATG